MRVLRICTTTAFAVVGALVMTSRVARRLLQPIDLSPP